ncbi:NAD-dependent epimerase/dehydratase family protein [Paenibacillus hodogayensis]|uniref:NAD-dependent epimerase/dehydratase family protein n=1 Tax=Paenibacillus hodogayensis TaxID=279208 RepID=A0ABV5W470_9BACL
MDMASDGQEKKKIRVIVTGVTGMVGEGVLHECLRHPDVERVLVLGRKPCGVTHPKLEEHVQPDLFDLSAAAARLSGYNACFFCLGVSSVGMTEEAYTRVTYDLTVSVAELLCGLNPGMVFCYVTGNGTDSTERGRSMWARVKGRTENKLLRLPFGGAYMFRPGYIHPTPGLRNTHGYYKAFMWMYPALRRFMPRYVISLRELGLAMIHTVGRGYEKPVLENVDIAALAKA